MVCLRLTPCGVVSLRGREMVRPVRHFALGFAIATVALLDVAAAWLAKQRYIGSAVGVPEVPAALLQTRWGGEYFVLKPSRVADGSLVFVFSEDSVPSGEGPEVPEVPEGPEVPEPPKGPEGPEGPTTPGGGGAEEFPEEEVDESIKQPWQSDQPTSCAAKEMTFDKADAEVFLTVVEVRDFTVCQRACANDERCKAAVFESKRGTCELARRLSHLTSASGSTVVMPHCYQGCFKSGKRPKVAGSLLGETPNPQMCQSLCRNFRDCQAFSWGRGSHKCVHYKESGGTEDVKGWLWGPRDSCISPEKPYSYAGRCEEEGLTANYAENMQVIPNHKDNVECRISCYKNRRCVWATYNTKTRLCYLKSERAEVTVSPVEGDVTFPRLCQSGCYFKDLALIGDTVAEFEDEKNAYYCHQRCYTDSRCRYWHWYGAESRKCILHGVAAGQTAKFMEGHWSGDRGGCSVEVQYHGRQDTARGGILKYYAPVEPEWMEPVFNEVPNVEACHKECQADRRCAIFYYESEKMRCRLSEKVSDFQKGPADVIAYAGVKNPSTACYKPNKAIDGERLEGKTMTMQTAALCQRLCNRTEGCNSFVWGEEDHSCVFMKTGNLDGAKVAVGFFSGPKEPCKFY